LTSKRVAKELSIETDANLFARMAHEILKQGTEKYCPATPTESSDEVIDDFETSDLAREIAEYSDAIVRDPTDAETFHGRGLAHYDKGDYDAALSDFFRATELDSTYGAAY